MRDHALESRSHHSLRVTELARLTGVTPATVRYYSRVGLLQPQRERSNGYRRFAAADRHRVTFIRRAQAFGLTIGDIKSILESSDRGEVPSDRVLTLMAERLSDVQARLRELQTIEARISKALATWSETSERAPRDGEICPLIDRVNPEAAIQEGLYAFSQRLDRSMSAKREGHRASA